MTIRSRLTVANAVIIAVVTSALGLAIFELIQFNLSRTTDQGLETWAGHYGEDFKHRPYLPGAPRPAGRNGRPNQPGQVGQPDASQPNPASSTSSPSSLPPGLNTPVTPAPENATSSSAASQSGSSAGNLSYPSESDRIRADVMERDLHFPRAFKKGSPTSMIDRRDPWDAAAVNMTWQDGLQHLTTTSKTYSTTGVTIKVRVITLKVNRQGEDYVIQLAEALDPVDAEMARIRDALVILIPSSWLAALVAALYLTDSALKPVKRINHDAQGLLTGRPDKRLPVEGADEMAQLATTINHGLDEIEKGYRRLEQFVADASHELKSPLTTIMLRSTPVKAGCESPTEQADNLDAIRRAAARMRTTVNDLLLVARMDGGQEAQMKPTDLAEALAEVADEFIDRFEDRLISEIQPGLKVMADKILIKRLVTNLLENAWRYAGDKAEVKLDGYRQGSKVFITVSDNGPGVAEEHIPHLLERFYRADAARTHSDTGEGSGLGLAIVGAIAHHHGGVVKVDSGIGQGFSVTIQLPGLQS